jgi:hypothetical protein
LVCSSQDAGLNRRVAQDGCATLECGSCGISRLVLPNRACGIAVFGKQRSTLIVARYERVPKGQPMKLLGMVLALACCGTGAAKADWEYTKWGMTPQQVVSASKNLAKAGSDLHPDSDGNVTKLVAPYQNGKFSFEAQFGFDAANRLSSVTLVLNDKSTDMDMESMETDDKPMNMDHGSMSMDHKSMNMDRGICHDLDVSLNTAHGPPPYHGASHLYAIEKWQDQKNKNNVDYHALYQVGCYVQYSAIKSSGAH